MNILDSSGRIMLYSYSNYFNSDGVFTLKNGEYRTDGGDLILLAGKRLNFYKTEYNGVIDYNIEFKNMYRIINGVMYSIEGGVINVPQQYKSLDSDGNLVISKDFFNDSSIKSSTPDFFKKTDSGYTVPQSCYTLRSAVRQPQAAMVITDYRTGQVKAMVGGRDTSGRLLFNRAINPRQPGSVIKPLAIYSSALQQGKDAADAGTPMTFTEYDSNTKSEYYGDYWTASSGLNDDPIKLNGKDWPQNWYSGYKGLMTMRKAVEQSVNTTAVRVYQQIGSSYAINMLEKFGISTVVKEGASNDANPSALALGGMVKGISPLELSSAFGVFPNGGTLQSPIVYTSVENKSGEILLECKSEETKVIDTSVAFIMQDILKSTVEQGIAAYAKVPGKATAGKTGTTSDSMDIWFCGFTGQYSAALWIGNDVNITLNATSDATARLWSKIMTKATAGMSGSLLAQPSDVISLDGEYYVAGTEEGRTFEPGMDEEKLKEKEEEEKKKEEEENKKEEESDTEKPEEGSGSETDDPTVPPSGGDGSESGNDNENNGDEQTPPSGGGETTTPVSPTAFSITRYEETPFSITA